MYFIHVRVFAQVLVNIVSHAIRFDLQANRQKNSLHTHIKSPDTLFRHFSHHTSNCLFLLIATLNIPGCRVQIVYYLTENKCTALQTPTFSWNFEFISSRTIESLRTQFPASQGVDWNRREIHEQIFCKQTTKGERGTCKHKLISFFSSRVFVVNTGKIQRFILISCNVCTSGFPMRFCFAFSYLLICGYAKRFLYVKKCVRN